MIRDALNPLSIWCYYRRHWQRTLLLLGLISLTTLGLYLSITIVITVALGSMAIDSHYLQNVSLVRPQGDNEQTASIVAQMRAHPAVAEVMPVANMSIGINTLVGVESYQLLGLQAANIDKIMSVNGLTLKSGRHIQPRTSEFMLSEELAANLGLQIGDQIDYTLNEANYYGIREPMTLVGLLAGDTHLGIVSYEYLTSNELYGTSHWFLVIAQPDRGAHVNDYLVNTIGDAQADFNTLQLLLAERANNMRTVLSIFSPIALLLTIVVTAVIAVIKRIEVTRRLAEFGIMVVVGYGKNWLTRRLAAETALLALSGWSVGIGLPWLILTLLENLLFAPRGYSFQPFQLPAFLLTTPIPIAILLFVVWRVAHTFTQIDGIAIIEHGELEVESSQRVARKVRDGNVDGGHGRSSLHPLSSTTYYKRHSRRAALLIGAMALMIMAVVALIFSFTTGQDALLVSLGNRTRMSQLYSLVQTTVSPGVSAQVRAHTAVERVIPAIDLYTLSMSVPPFSKVGIGSYAVSEEDMRYLIHLYGLQIKEGRLPRPRTNEIIIAEATAANRQLQVGELIGRAGAPAYEGDTKLPAPLEVVGIFARATTKAEENWLAFASLEFIQGHEGFEVGLSLLVVPKAGQKAALDEWLESEVATSQVAVDTYRRGLAQFQANERGVILVLTLIEGVVAIVAAITMAVLNYIFLTQRQTEFGVLNALGHGRRWLLWRTLRESIFITAAAWLLSLVLCLFILAYLQWGVYQPMGIPLNFSNPLPWLFTLPVPVAVLIASAISIRQMLYKLDTVAIIERN